MSAIVNKVYSILLGYLHLWCRIINTSTVIIAVEVLDGFLLSWKSQLSPCKALDLFALFWKLLEF